MRINIFEGILIPFVGTTLGAACVFFMRKTLSKSVQRALAGFAAGIMVAASIWSLLIPAIKQSENMGTLSFVPAVAGFWIGILFLLALDHLIPHLHVGSDQAEGPKSKLGRTTMMVLAVTLHNIPEGMATFMASNTDISLGISLTIAIALHNIPEGISISVPIYYATNSKIKAISYTALSGLSELFGAIITYLFLKPFINDIIMGLLFSIIAGIMMHLSLIHI